jgi:hypothetical protein
MKIGILDPEWMLERQLQKLDFLLELYPDNLFLHQAKCLNLYAKRNYEAVQNELSIIFHLDTDNIMYLCRYARLMAEALFNNLEPN